jgi:hypothetical protein
MNAPRRVLRVRFFLGSTTEEIQLTIEEFLRPGVCPGNYVDLKLWKHGAVYQAALVYAELEEEKTT